MNPFTLRQRLVTWLFRGGIHLPPGVTVGENSITLSASGDVIRWSGTRAAQALGDIGMDVTTGRPSFFVGGAAIGAAVTSDGLLTGSGSTTRTAAAGTGTVNVAHGLARAPTMFFFNAIDDADAGIGSLGWARNGAGAVCIRRTSAAVNFQQATAINILNATDGYTATVSAVDATNFTISYTVAGAGRAITVQWAALA